MAQSGAYRVAPSDVTAAATQINSGAVQLHDLLSRLKGIVNGTGQYWEGASQTRFISLNQDWHRACEQCEHALSDIALLTKDAARVYTECETAVTNAFSG